MLQTCISSDVNELNKLNETYNWLPNEKTIRPNDNDKLKKYFMNNEISYEWKSMKDFILHKVFNQNYVLENNKKSVIDTEKINDWVFQESMFRYDIPQETNHYILWNKNNFTVHFSNEVIDMLIKKHIKEIVNHDNFDFGWYVNPQPTVHDFYHVQVFWILIDK